jgi:hypothetical protein
MSQALMVAVSVGTPLALLGLVAALAYFAYARQLKYQEKKLDALPPAERAARTDEYLTRYGIDGKKLAAADKLALIKDEMDKRHRRSMGFGIMAAIVFVVCFALSVAAYIVANVGGGKPVQDNRPRRLHGPEPVEVSKAAQFFRTNATTFPGMDKLDVISQFAELPVTTQGYFFCSHPIDTARTDPTVTVKGIASTSRPYTVEVHIFVPPSHVERDLHARTSEVSDGIATLKLKGAAPEGSAVFVAYWVEGPETLELGNLEVYLQ